MNSGTIDSLLRNLASRTGIQGVVLVSSQGLPLSMPIGLTQASALMMAGTMLHLAGCIRKGFQWQGVDWVSIEAEEGYIILSLCSEDAFLLIKAAHTPSGYLDNHINQLVSKLHTELQSTTMTPPDHRQWHHTPITTINDFDADTGQPAKATRQLSPITPPTTETVLGSDFIAQCQQELAEFIGPMASFICQQTHVQHPEFGPMEFVETLTAQIPNPQDAMDFKRRIQDNVGHQG